MVRRTEFGSLATSWPAIKACPHGDRNQRGHHADQRRLARAIGPEQAEDFAIFYAEGNVVDRGEVAILFDDVLHIKWRMAFRRML